MNRALGVGQRVALWDAALTGVRRYLRDTGVREVSTPVCVAAPALEPYIEPIVVPGWAPERVSEAGYLITSPELAMKRLLCRGSGSIAQVAHCFRAGERGPRHDPEFHLLEWYRVGAEVPAVMRDVEAFVAVGVSAAAEIAGPPPPLSPPLSWTTHAWFALFEHTTGIALTGDEDEPGLRAATAASDLLPALPPALRDSDAAVRTLWAWTALFTSWSDGPLDAWLAAQQGGVHIVDFPAPLAALARCARDHRGRHVARRFESHVRGVELANGYWELGDPVEQRRRFEWVAGLRQVEGRAPLPLDQAFLADLEHPGLPDCSGCALGLERLLMVATGQPSIHAIALTLSDVTVHGYPVNGYC